MTPAFTARGRAEEFNSLVEGISASELTDARYVDVLELVEAMRYVPKAQPRPEFVADLRARLMAAAETALAPATDAELRARLTVAPRRTPRERRIAIAVGGFAIVGATTSMAVAAQTALPGDTLYPLKRALENARAGVQVDEGNKGTTLLANASGRLDEVDELSRSQQREDDGIAIAETLQAFTNQATEASDLLIASYAETGQQGAIEELREFTSDSMTALEELEGLVPPEARAALIQAAQTLFQIDQQATSACPTCLVKTVTEIPDVLFNNVSTLLGVPDADTVPEAKDEVQQPSKPDKGGKGDQGGSDAQPPAGDGSTPAPPPVLPTPPAGGGGGGGADEQPNVITELTEGLTGGGNGGSGGNGGGSGGSGGTSVPTQAPDLGEVVEDTVDGVTDLLFP